MSVRLYIGNLPQNVNVKELEALLASIGDGIKFKAVFDRDTKACRGFGFANIKDENIANELIEKLNGYEFNGNKLRVERSERKDSNSGNSRRGEFNRANNDCIYGSDDWWINDRDVFTNIQRWCFNRLITIFLLKLNY